MLLSDDRNLPMPLQKTQISTISFGHSVGTGRTGVRPAPDVPRGCPPHRFLRQEGPANPSAATFLSQQSFGYCPRAKRSRSNTHAGVVGYLFETAHNAIAPMWQPGPTYVRANSAASSSVRTVTSRARRRGGLNTKSIMPRKLARHNRSSSGARRRCGQRPRWWPNWPNYQAPLGNR